MGDASLSTNAVLIAGIDRGLTLDGALAMDLGALLDYCIEWNEIHGIREEQAVDSKKNKEEKPRVRNATQADINKLLGG